MYFYAPGSDQRRYLYVMPKEQAEEFGDFRPGTPRFILAPYPTDTDAATFRSLVLEQLEKGREPAERRPARPFSSPAQRPFRSQRPLQTDKPNPGELDEFTREYAKQLGEKL